MEGPVRERLVVLCDVGITLAPSPEPGMRGQRL